MNNLVDALLPSSRPRFHRDEIRINNEPHELYYRDVLDCVRCLYGSAEFAPYLVFTPEQHYSDPNRTSESRLYHDMHTGKWWWWTQEQLEKETPGATVVPIILSSDKTQVTTFGDKSAYPVYMTIGNLPKEIWRKPSRQGQILLAYLPTSKFESVSNKAARRRLIANLFHGCMRLILEPLVKAGKDGVTMASGDGVIRRCHPLLAAYSADYMEQIVVAGINSGQCPVCMVPRKELGEWMNYPLRSLADVKEALNAWDKRPDKFFQECAAVRIKPIVHPFWEDLPYCNIFLAIVPDILHQLKQGMIKHLFTWIKTIYGKAEIDARCKRLPPNHHVRHFFKGITPLSRLTGTEHADVAKILLGIIIDLPIPGGHSATSLIKATRALLDFFYLAQYPVHSSESLAELEEALTRFHANKSVFEALGIRTSWIIPKLHFLMHYLTLIKWLGTCDNFDTAYTERLHIDMTKDAFNATNGKDEYAQMTLWLERKEKVLKHESYITWVLAGQPPITYQPLNPSITERIHMTKRPTRRAVHFNDIVQQYGATFIRDAIARYVVKFNNPDLSWNQVETRASYVNLLFQKLQIYHKVKLWLGNNMHHRLSSDEFDVVHAKSSHKNKYGQDIPGRFDTVLVNDGTGEFIGIKGYRVAQVRLIFSLPSHVISGLFPGHTDIPKYFAYVEWFKAFENAPRPHHLLFKVTRSTQNGNRLASVISLDNIDRSVHLIPCFGAVAPREWTMDNVLENCNTFYVNSFANRYNYHTII